jgi:hypothetical protein
VPAEAKTYDVYVKLIPPDGQDIDTTDNIVSANVGYTDVAVEKIYITENLDKRDVHIEVRNKRSIPVNNVTVNFRENDFNGPIFSQRMIDNLAMNEAFVMSQQFDVDDVDFINGSKTVYAEVYSSAQEYNIDNNYG